jgi:DNA-binding NtrC family response regulator
MIEKSAILRMFNDTKSIKLESEDTTYNLWTQYKKPLMENLSVMIVSLPGTLQRVLQRNIESYPYVNVVGVVSGTLTASKRARQLSPHVMIIDSTIPFDDAMALVENLEQENLETKSIVITDTTQQRRRILRTGADYTLASFDYESRIGEILNQLKDLLLDSPHGTETTANVDSWLAE